MRHSSVGSTEVWNASIQLHGIDTIQLSTKGLGEICTEGKILKKMCLVTFFPGKVPHNDMSESRYRSISIYC